MKQEAPKFERKTPQVRRQQLIEAAIRCLSRGGISGFTVDRICKEAGVSRGLINHYFDGKDELLVCAYESMTGYLVDSTSPSDHQGSSPGAGEGLARIIESSFDYGSFKDPRLRAWLALWGEIPSNPRLQALHRRRYGALKLGLSRSINAIAAKSGATVDGERLARLLIATIDGLWLEYCLDPAALSLDDAKQDCLHLIESHLKTKGVSVD